MNDVAELQISDQAIVDREHQLFATFTDDSPYKEMSSRNPYFAPRLIRELAVAQLRLEAIENWIAGVEVVGDEPEPEPEPPKPARKPPAKKAAAKK